MENNNPKMNKKQILKSLLFALIIGAIVVVGAIWPAEFNKDPLGTGELFGFSKLYVPEKSNESNPSQNFKKITLANIGSPEHVAKPEEAYLPAPKTQFGLREDEILIPIKAGKSLEYKFDMLKYGQIKYEWSTNTGIVYLDFHGEVKLKNPAPAEFFESYTLAYSNNMAGTLTAPFTGKHGWYFSNKSNEDIIITLKLKGQYLLRQ